MPCHRCDNPEYPEIFDTKSEAKYVGKKYCKNCGYPGLSKTAQRIVDKALKVSPLIAGPGLKGIDMKYWSETLDSKARPLDVLDPLKEQWKQLDLETGGPNFYDWLAEKEGNVTVLQLHEELDRAPYLATIAGGELAAESVVPNKMEYAFVLAPDDKFYAGPKSTSGPLRLHHSSFLAGRPAKCAGVFFCATNAGEHKRKITYVKDYSGHYQPGIPEILRLKESLVELGEGAIELRFFGGKYVEKYKGPISGFTGKGAGLNEV